MPKRSQLKAVTGNATRLGVTLDSDSIALIQETDQKHALNNLSATVRFIVRDWAALRGVAIPQADQTSH